MKLKSYLTNRFFTSDFPLSGYPHVGIHAPFLNLLDDKDLERLNKMLPWKAFTVDGNGRRFGNCAWDGKRNTPQTIPDLRIVQMHERFNLSNKSVLEIGCFEGIHTAGLMQYCNNVKAIDARIENVVKTIVRCAMLGKSPAVFLFNLEDALADVSLLQADLAHHVGVLYHLKDPVRHLLDIVQYVREGIMLDTHYSEDSDATHSYTVNGRVYDYKPYKEYGRDEVFSGMYDHSKWLRLNDIFSLLKEGGFTQIEVVQKRQERNGPRVLIFASREKADQTQ